MTYTLKDVDGAVAIVRSERPDAIIQRGDYGWALSIADKSQSSPGVILFQPEREDIGQSEISTAPEDVYAICFFLGGQWTAEEAAKLATAASSRAAIKINRIQRP